MGRTARLRKGPQIQRDEHRQERQSESKKFIYSFFQVKTPSEYLYAVGQQTVLGLKRGHSQGVSHGRISIPEIVLPRRGY